MCIQDWELLLWLKLPKKLASILQQDELLSIHPSVSNCSPAFVLFSFFLSFFLEPHSQHMEVPR